MSDGAKCQSVESLQELFETKISGLEEKIELHFKLGNKALEVAQEDMDRRLDEMNNFRESLKDQAGSFLTRTEYEAKHETLLNRVEESTRPNWLVILSFLALTITLYFSTIQPLTDQVSKNTDKIQEISDHGSVITQQRLNTLEEFMKQFVSTHIK